jgi:ribose/xylose/arabinose/galactoside ABC-type transport system permease subunit
MGLSVWVIAIIACIICAACGFWLGVILTVGKYCDEVDSQ